jgi:hypothetical protein
MPKGLQGQKRLADIVANAIRVAKILTGEVEEDMDQVAKDPAARALEAKGRKARAAKMTSEHELRSRSMQHLFAGRNHEKPVTAASHSANLV